MNLNDINNKLTLILNELTELARNASFEPVSIFQIDSVNSDMNWSEIEIPGIYLIEIENNGEFSNFEKWLDNFRSAWSHPDFHGKYTPSIKLKRIRTHNSMSKWIPLYIGRSKKISGRFHGHMYTRLDQRTFALKLKARHNLKHERFRLSKIALSEVNYNTVAPIYELEQRNLINPIVGKQ